MNIRIEKEKIRDTKKKKVAKAKTERRNEEKGKTYAADEQMAS